MSPLDLGARSELSAKLRARRSSVAHAVTTEFLERHPDFSRFGARAYQRGVEDAAYHVDFLSAAVEAGSVAVFGDYLRWTGRVLAARGIPAALLLENVEQVTRAVLAETAGEEAALVRDICDGALVRFSEIEHDAPANDTTAPHLVAACALFVETILRGDRKAAFQIALDALEREQDTSTVYVALFQRAMHDIGKRWESSRVTVAQEHMASVTVQCVVAQLYSRLPMQPATRGKVLITGVEGEHHQLGANLVADVLEASGFDVRFLGTDVPEAAALRAIDEERPAIVGVSATMAFNLPKAVALVRAVRARKDPPRVLLGGAAFAATPDLVAELGVVGVGCDVSQALALAKSALV